MQGEHGEHTLNTARTTKQVARHGLGGAHHGLVGMVAQGRLDRVGFVDVAQGGGRAVGIEIVHLIHIDPGIAQRTEHGAPRPVHVGSRHVPGICAHAKAAEFGVNLGTSGLGVLVLFQHHHASALAEHKTVAVFVPWAGCRPGIVVAGGQCAHGGKPANAQRGNRGFGPAGHDHVGITVFDHASCLANAVQARCAGSHHSKVGALEAKTHGHMPCHHVDDGRRDKKWGDTPGSTADQFGVGVFDQRQAANAGADHAGNACGELLTERFPRGKSCVLHGLRRGSNAVVDEGVHRARVLGADVRLQVKTFDLSRNLAGEVRRVELGDEVNAGLAGKEVGPGIGHRVTHGADATQAGHDNATTAHA